jgi:hypothetical protein
MREHHIDKMHSSIVHPSSDARGAKTSAFARKGDKFFVATVFALSSDETVVEYAAFQIPVDFFLYKRRQAAVFFGFLFERSPMRFDDLVERVKLRLPPSA